MPAPTNRSEVDAYIQQVADALRGAGVPVSRVRIDSPEKALELGREWACIELAGEWRRFCLVWNDHADTAPLSGAGWMVSTHANHYPIRPGREVHPTPADVARQARSHMHILRHGGYVQALPAVV